MRVAIIGGDRRMLCAAQAFLSDGDSVRVAGFERGEERGECPCVTLEQALRSADIAVLPVRPLAGERLSTPFSAEEIRMSQLGAMIGSTPLFCGCADAVRPYVHGRVYDYAAREEFCIRNAVLTAEGALELILREYPDALFGTKMLVLGYGRIGRILARYLRSLGSQVTVAARSEASRAWARAEGHDICDMALNDIGTFCVIVNTIPAQVLSAQRMAQMRRNALIVDLASAPGGTDKEAAEHLGIRCIHALALPGRTAPAAAGRIIKDTIRTILKEENGGKDNSRLCDDRFLLHL